MRFFSKFVFICNLCFLVQAAFHYFKAYLSDSKFPQPLNFLKGTIVILGEFSWILNIILFLLVLVFLLMRRPTGIPKWLLLVNGLIFIFQVYFFQLYTIFIHKG